MIANAQTTHQNRKGIIITGHSLYDSERSVETRLAMNSCVHDSKHAVHIHVDG